MKHKQENGGGVSRVDVSKGYENKTESIICSVRV